MNRAQKKQLCNEYLKKKKEESILIIKETL